MCAASWSDKDPGLQYAHEAWVVDTKDKTRLGQLCAANNIQGVLTTGTDVAIQSIGHICDSLNLPGISYQTAVAATDKKTMHDKFLEFGVPSAQYIDVSDWPDAVQAITKLGLPAIIKAPDSSGSRGIFIIDELSDLQEAYTQSMQISRCGYVLIEEYISGEEFGAQAIVMDGEIALLILHNDTVTAPPVRVPVGHSVPFSMDRCIEQQAAEVCQKGVQAIAIDQGVCNIDLLYDGQQVFMLEIGARIGATGIPEIIDLTYGLDLYEIALDLCLGEIPDLNMQPQTAAANQIIQAPQNGILRHIHTPPDAYQAPGVVSIHFDTRPGEYVRRFSTGPDRIGEVRCSALSAGQAEALCRHVISQIQLTIDQAED
ncbi:MAG: ATP-grasp domain-containing protein [Desulfovermiculus sp.]|nr:ATP-grasp domain-containing protein [Desulfovermiculus sp.]